jgi:hypothetical protein
MELAVHVARVGEMRNTNKIFAGISEEKRPLTDLGIDGRIILKYILSWI